DNVLPAPKIGERAHEQLSKHNVAQIILLVDDFLGSGDTFNSALRGLRQSLDGTMPSWEEYVVIVAGAALGTKDGLEAVRRANPSVRVTVAEMVSDRLRAFSPESRLFDSVDHRLDMEARARFIGESLTRGGPVGPLGYNDDALLLVFERNSPNNSL